MTHVHLSPISGPVLFLLWSMNDVIRSVHIQGGDANRPHLVMGKTAYGFRREEIDCESLNSACYIVKVTLVTRIKLAHSIGARVLGRTSVILPEFSSRKILVSSLVEEMMNKGISELNCDTRVDPVTFCLILWNLMIHDLQQLASN